MPAKRKDFENKNIDNVEEEVVDEDVIEITEEEAEKIEQEEEKEEAEEKKKEKKNKKEKEVIYGNIKKKGSFEVECKTSRGSFKKGLNYFVSERTFERYSGNLSKIK